jgi:alginate O-acetyltransferase complex protein AlgI
MTFASADFIFYFFPIFLPIYFLAKDIRAKNFVLVLFSLIFYSASKPVFLLILIASIAVNYRLALAIDRATGSARHRLLGYGVIGNLLPLAIFKYTAFLAQNLNALLAVAGLKVGVPAMALPLGISFYTFHAISYIADVAKGKVAANRRFGEFMLYMSMFPQLVAGPIVRYSQVANQLRYRRQTPGRFSAGMRIFIIGLAWKLLIADQISGVADFVFDGERAPLLIESWLGLYAYAMQIYFDFGGYSAMAVGLGIMVGFTLPRNFRVPYSASSITAFWRRWHMSLSAWLRDYLYIPLGGSRGTTLRTYINLSMVFLLCGLWHGTSWNFVVWGGYDGLLLIIERTGWSSFLARLPRELAHIYTVVAVFFGWVWFRANDFIGAIRVFRGLFGLNGVGELPVQLHFMLSPVVYLVLTLAGVLSLWKWPRWQLVTAWGNSSAYAIADTGFVVVLLLICMIVAASSGSSPFLYYRF